ncbi:ABC-type transport auxiliary lipoprotein family protein [Simplicispira psychrophila]|uniref:ABC-type transport auxiliary lipoprotein family protein n=1 Tax=Simplicispira psychrophila TaxID=80882 RepID=UPI00055E2D43|nr:ABC-type transport auxiliary lipoprotein family protein [Simplicispira psychrophila]
MNTFNSIAISARHISITAVFTAIFVAGCSSLPAPPPRPVLYDFGPGALGAVAVSSRVPPVSNTSATSSAPLPAIALAEVEGAGNVDASTAVLYRLAYADARQLRPYQLARWSLPPAQLVAQDLRAQLGQRRAVLRIEDGLAAAREGSANGMGGSLPDVLRVRLEEFSQVFTSAHDSVGLVRLRATLLEPTAEGEKLRGQRLFVVQQPARSADAAGGTRALAEASTQAAQQLSQWLEQLGR